MDELSCPDGNQDNTWNCLLYENMTFKIYNSFSSLVCEAEQAFYDTGKVEIIIGKTKYRILYRSELFEFDQGELLTDEAFNKKYLASGFNIVNFTHKGWLAYVYEIQKKAIICDETEYEPYVAVARDYCYFILSGGIYDKSDCDKNDLIGNEKYCYKSIEAIKDDIKDLRFAIDIELLGCILERVLKFILISQLG